MTHANASFTELGRLKLAQLVVDQGWPIERVADRFQCASGTVRRWVARYRAGEPMTDRSSRPHRSPNRIPTRLERRIIALRFNRRWGPHRIGYHLGVARSTVGRVLARFKMPLLRSIDQATGLPVRKAKPVRYEVSRPGELVHVDIKKQGRIPDGGGHRKLGRTAGNRNNGKRGLGYAFLHQAIDDNTRIAYSESLDDEKKETAAGFMQRAIAFYATIDIQVAAVMTDNGSCYRSHAFKDALGEGIKHRRTRPYRPQTNGKVERFNRTLEEEWAYAKTYRSEAERAADFPAWLHHYNHHRPHTGIGGLTPMQRLHNVTGKNS